MLVARSRPAWLATLVAAVLLGAMATVVSTVLGARPAAAASCEAALLAVDTNDSNLYRWVRDTPTSGGFSARAQVGGGWGGIAQIASDSATGNVFAIDSAGNLRLYAFAGTGYTGGSVIDSTHFQNIRFLVPGGNGVLYAVQSNGNLQWWRWLPAGTEWVHDHYASVSARWHAGSGTVIGTGWGSFSKVFGGGNGVLYGVASNGDLLWYRHQTPGLGVGSWLGPRKVGAGWGGFKEIAGVDGAIYATTSTGALLFYNHTGIENGTYTWSSDTGASVGSDWTHYNRLTVNPKACTPAPARADRVDIPLYLVHGIEQSLTNDPAADCAKTWGSALTRFPGLGWTGPVRTVGYYNRDANCDDMIDRTDYTGALDNLGASLAWDLYDNYSSFGRPVDVVAHSMGGLILRAAITGVAKGDSRFPPYLYVINAVTMDTPHTGQVLAGICDVTVLAGFVQCRDLAPQSGFLAWLTPNPQSTIGTDWTLLASANDNFVPWPTSLGYDSVRGHMDPGHRVIFKCGLDHSEMNSAYGASGCPVNHWEYHGQALLSGDQAVSGAQPNWPYLTGFLNNSGPYPVDWAFRAAQYWSRW